MRVGAWRGNLDVGKPSAGADSDSKQDTCQSLWLGERSKVIPPVGLGWTSQSDPAGGD